MENFEVFITILAWFGLVVGFLISARIMFNTYELNNTARGRLRQMLANSTDTRIVPRSPALYIIMFIVSLAWLVAYGY